MKILLWDIETAPLLAFIWGPKTEYVSADLLQHDSFMLCWSAKWHGEAKIHTGVLTSQEAIDQDDARIVGKLADLMREADIIVAHNGDKFDMPMFNSRLLTLGLEPLGPRRSIDTLKLARSNFRLAYNRLDYLGEILGLGRKIKTSFSLWKGCYHGDRKSLNEMLRYNKQDVVLLEAVFDKLMPYVKSLPRMVDPTEPNDERCPHCGGTDLMRRGRVSTNSCTYQTFHCQDCRRYCRSRISEKWKLAYAPV